MALSVNTPTHLQGIGLMPPTNSTSSDRENVAYLFHNALEKVGIIIFKELLSLKFSCHMQFSHVLVTFIFGTDASILKMYQNAENL